MQLTASTTDILAIEGGSPVRSTLLPFGVPCIGEEEISEVTEALRSGWIGSGPRALQFEREFAAYVGADHAISLNSCTAGLFLSLKLSGVGPGAEVILPTFTFAATANVVEHLGATPVFVDIEPDTLNVDPERVAEAITERTGAIVPVHFAGLTCDMSALLELAQRHGLALVEDAAHATGARYAGRMVGSIGAATAFSFYANKNLTTAEGGMLTTNDNRLAKLARVYRSHGLSTDAWGRFGEGHVSSPEVVLPGYSFAMPDLAAALGLPQLRKQEHFLTMRERYAHLYDEAFEDLPVRTQPRPRDLELNRHALHIYVLTLEPGTLRVSRDRLVEALRAENIGAGVHYLPLHEHPFYKEKHGYKPSDFPVAHAVGEHILSLPLTAGMSAQDAEDVALAVRKVLAAYAN